MLLIAFIVVSVVVNDIMVIVIIESHEDFMVIVDKNFATFIDIKLCVILECFVL